MDEREENTVEELAEEIQNALEEATETLSKEVSESEPEEAEPEENEPEEEEQKPDRKKKNRIIIGVVIAVIVIACIIGFMSCSNNEKESEPVETEEEQETAPPIITLKDEDTVVTGINREIALQDVVKSIESEVGIESVVVELEDSTEEESKDAESTDTESKDAKSTEEKEESTDSESKDVVIISDIKDGKEVNGVPAMSLTFKEEGTYVINVTAIDTEDGETVMPITFEVGGELLSYVQGLRDWSVEKGSKDIDFMDGVTWDKEHVSSVTVDASKVKLDTVGSYDLVYTIKGKIANEETTITKKVTVKVVDEKTAQEKADAGEKVTTTGNEVKKDSSGNKPSGVTSSNSSNSGSQSTGTKPSSSGSQSSGQGGTKPSQSSGNSNSSGSTNSSGGSTNSGSNSSTQAHTHTWVTVPAQTHTVNHPAETHQEDQGWDEEIKGATHWVCGCGADFTSVKALHDHQGSYADNGDFSHPGNSHTYIEPSQWVHHENWVTVVDREAWVETVVDVPAYQKCSVCGATK